ncbi:uncharacterized protein B0I36DRAFT_314074 [Microdochium trichocladiopsis]|uniref:Secreted protein n=1 Tax=Microdochium trichocladiopsis TaxID=1682393 RepID=A0A9P8YEK0_9PEZI|nr:uncharacterized protein B0I36DRAFT_314074 [Microdochium trichocladiopsis]KAH7037442.1 hypothetical protein B0I36DRAFT_314074 [Microdochium trichocladiopsis]
MMHWNLRAWQVSARMLWGGLYCVWSASPTKSRVVCLCYAEPSRAPGFVTSLKKPGGLWGKKKNLVGTPEMMRT